MKDSEHHWKKLLKYLADREYPICDVDDESKGILTYISGDYVSLRLFVWLDKKSKTLDARWYYPTNVPLNKHHIVLDLMNRLNYRILYGGFIMDPEDGFLIFRISVPISDTDFVNERLDKVFGVGLCAADEEYPKFMSVIYGEPTAGEVLEGKGQPQLKIVDSSNKNDNQEEKVGE